MSFKTLITTIFFLFASLILAAVWIYPHDRETSTALIDDGYLGTALTFSHAVYVKDWDSAGAGFALTTREEDGTYRLLNNIKDSSKAFNRLAKNGWHLYFNEIRAAGHVPQDAQILTGSKIEPNNKLTFVITFRGSDKREDYLYTNCKNEPVAFESVKHNSLSPGLSGENIGGTSDTSIVASMMMGTWTAWVSNLRSGSPVLVHRGYAEQVYCGLSAPIVDPIDLSLLTVREALGKYPSANVIITGHSSGGAAAHILSALAVETGLNQHRRIRTRTFAAAGAFNSAGRQRYKNLDSINYIIAGDPILLVNDFSGYGPLGVNLVIPASSNVSNYSRTVHEMTAYEERLNTH